MMDPSRETSLPIPRTWGGSFCDSIPSLWRILHGIQGVKPWNVLFLVKMSDTQIVVNYDSVTFNPLEDMLGLLSSFSGKVSIRSNYCFETMVSLRTLNIDYVIARQRHLC